jgi:hypothetical protein
MSQPTVQGFSQATLASPYIIYKLTSRYVRDEGVLQMPISVQTGPGGIGAVPPGMATVTEVQATEPTAVRVVSFSIVRLNALPVAPDPTPRANEVLAHTEIEEDAPTPDSEGRGLAYVMSGVYIFHLQAPPEFGVDSLPVGSVPALNTSGVTEIDADQFQSDII